MKRTRISLAAITADEHGASTVEWIGATAVIAALLVVLVLAFTTQGELIGNTFGSRVRAALQLSAAGNPGQAAPGEASPGAATRPDVNTPVTAAQQPAQSSGWLDGFQTVLDLVGLVPVLGEPADLLNGAIYAVRGDMVNAGFSLVALWPAGGQAATAAKFGIRYGDEAIAAVRQGDNAVDAARRSADEAAALTRQSDEADALLRRDPCISWRSGKSVPGLAAPAAAVCDFPPGSNEHRAQRWQEYTDRMKAEGKEPMPQSQWNNTYDANMQKAHRSSEAVQAYRDRRVADGENWPDYEITVDVDAAGTKRRLDIADVRNRTAIEHKKYEGGKVNHDPDIASEVQRDAALVRDDWQIEWVFEGCEPSQPLRDALEEAGIGITIIP
ncbi:MAG: hypothetical protein H7Z42_11995 [Roseiflexaceae bacterium]|nr:hypothetical protein [Roseiflexaceae bacterium]